MIKYLQQYIDDPWTLRLIRKFLTSGVLDHGLFAKGEFTIEMQHKVKK